MKPEIVFALYKPHKNKENELKQLISNHMLILKSNHLITDRKPILVQSDDGTYIEIFEWKSNSAFDEAHQNLEVQKNWNAMGKVCDFKTLNSIEEAKEFFPHFKPIN